MHIKISLSCCFFATFLVDCRRLYCIPYTCIYIHIFTFHIFGCLFSTLPSFHLYNAKCEDVKEKGRKKNGLKYCVFLHKSSLNALNACKCSIISKWNESCLLHKRFVLFIFMFFYAHIVIFECDTQHMGVYQTHFYFYSCFEPFDQFLSLFGSHIHWNQLEPSTFRAHSFNIIEFPWRFPFKRLHIFNEQIT